MSQIKTYQHFVFKLHTQRLKKAGWSLSLTLADARRNGELVALADSTLLRFMQELQGVANRAERIYTLKTSQPNWKLIARLLAAVVRPFPPHAAFWWLRTALHTFPPMLSALTIKRRASPT